MAERQRYTRKKKVAVVMAAAASSTLAAAEEAGIPESTVRYWVHHPEFAHLRDETRETNGEAAKVVSLLAIDKIRAKLDSFEPRDLVLLYGVMVDKMQLLTGEATSRSEHRDITDRFDDEEREKLRDAIDRILQAEEVEA